MRGILSRLYGTCTETTRKPRPRLVSGRRRQYARAGILDRRRNFYQEGQDSPDRGRSATGSGRGWTLQDHDIHAVMKILARETRDLQVPIVTEIAAAKRDPFQILVSTILSLRTKDETTRRASERLLKAAPSPERLLALEDEVIQELIYPVGFYRTKARVLHGIARALIIQHGGKVPDDLDTLLKLKGVGRKTANLVVTLGYGKPGICVDTHVHRICNRLGYVESKTPGQTESELRRKLPRKYWMVINDYLVAHGQHVCKPTSPLCSRCPIETYCERKGVTRHR